MKKQKQWIAFLIIGILCLAVTACSGKKDKNGSMKAEDGRSYGGTITAESGKEVQTAFFKWKVEEAEKYTVYPFDDGLYQADSGNTYLVVRISIENTYGEDLPMSITDFTLDYDGNKAKDPITGYGKTDLKNDAFMDNIFTLKKGESITKQILFTVKDMDAYTLNYKEYYEDKFEGDTYQIRMKPALQTSSETTEAGTQQETSKADATETTTEAATETTIEEATEATTEAAQQETTEAAE